MAEKGFGVKEINLIGASGTPTIESPNNLNLNAVNVAISTNVSVGGTLTVSGSLSIGGTITYEDVTNIDSIGIITARSGVVTPNVDVDDFITVGSNIQLGNAGVVTATTFSGSGASLTSIPAGQLTGTVADARISTLTASKLSGALPAISGANLTNLPSDTPTNSDIQVAYTVTANGSSAYRFEGNGVVSSADNPDIYLIRGQKYRFINNSGGSHPFQIREASGGTAYSTGVTNNGASSGNIDFAPTYDSPAQLVYQCTNHGGMVGNIYLRGGNGNNTNVGVSTFSGTSKIKPNSIGIGTNTTTGRNAGVGTAFGEIFYNVTNDRVQIYTKDNRWFNIEKSSYAGYYADTTAAIADGMSHYWPGNSSTSLISNLSPNQTTGSPVVNNTSGSYDSSFAYFDFYTGNANENGYRYTQTTTKWGNGPFTIAFWVQVMATTVEGESTFVQLGDHPSGVLRCLYSVSTDQNRQLKAITIGDDVSANNQAVFPTSWTHFVNTYSGSGTNQTKYYINGSLARTHTHSGNLDVGTGTKYIYIGSGYWNSDATNKASMSHMSDIGIWNAKELSASEIANLYNAKRTIAGS